jgi:hypothetical protein
MRSAIGKGLRRPRRFSTDHLRRRRALSSPHRGDTSAPATVVAFIDYSRRSLRSADRTTSPLGDSGPLGGHRDHSPALQTPRQPAAGSVRNRKVPARNRCGTGNGLDRGEAAFGPDENGNARLSQLPSVSISARHRSAPDLESVEQRATVVVPAGDGSAGSGSAARDRTSPRRGLVRPARQM